jgi:ATP-dependent DNA ligase
MALHHRRSDVEAPWNDHPVSERREHRAPPTDRAQERLERLFKKEIHGLHYSEHVITDGPRFRAQACKLGLEGVISKRIDRPYTLMTAGSG